MGTQIESLSDDELEELAARTKAALHQRKEGKRLDAVKEARKLLDAVGLSFREAERLTESGTATKKGAGKPKGQTAQKGARFVHPSDSSQSWTAGRGRKPKWLRELEDRGEAPVPV